MKLSLFIVPDYFFFQSVVYLVPDDESEEINEDESLANAQIIVGMMLLSADFVAKRLV